MEQRTSTGHKAKPTPGQLFIHCRRTRLPRDFRPHYDGPSLSGKTTQSASREDGAFPAQAYESFAGLGRSPSGTSADGALSRTADS